MLWVGHFDLTQAMGIPAQFQHPDFHAALQAVIAAARKHGKQAGIQPNSLDQAKEWRAAGFNIISWMMDYGVYRNALTQGIKDVRAILAGA